MVTNNKAILANTVDQSSALCVDLRENSQHLFISEEMEEEELTSSSFSVSVFNVDVPWGHIACKTWGEPSASPVLCLHGKQDNAGSFDALIPLLPSSFYYIAMDLPSHGLSSHMPSGRPLDILDFVMATDRVLRHFNWNNIQIIGHSLGSVIGFFYSALFPHRVTKLIALDPIFELQRSTKKLFDFIVSRHEKLLALEKALSSRPPPNYTKEEALHRIQKNRLGFQSIKAAQFLFPRGVTLNQGGFHFSADQRIKLTVPIFYTQNQMLELYSHIKCPLLVIRCSETDIARYPCFDEFHVMFRTSLGKLYHYKVVEGPHDLHMLEPEKIANDVTQYLSLGKSSL